MALAVRTRPRIALPAIVASRDVPAGEGPVGDAVPTVILPIVPTTHVPPTAVELPIAVVVPERAPMPIARVVVAVAIVLLGLAIGFGALA